MKSLLIRLRAGMRTGTATRNLLRRKVTAGNGSLSEGKTGVNGAFEIAAARKIKAAVAGHLMQLFELNCRFLNRDPQAASERSEYAPNANSENRSGNKLSQLRVNHSKSGGKFRREFYVGRQADLSATGSGRAQLDQNLISCSANRSGCEK